MTDVEVLRSSGRDADGNRGAESVAATLAGCAVAPASEALGQSSVHRDRRASDGSRERLVVYCPDVDADVTAVDRVRFDGKVYVVDGEPDRWRNPLTGARPGCVINVSRTVG